MNVAAIPAIPGARHRRKRVGRGSGSGHGKTATRGQKGQRARTGEGKRPGFEGGRTPLIRHLPKRGFRYKATGQTVLVEVINVRQLERCRDGERVTPERLRELGLTREPTARIKLLGDGALTKKLTVAVHAVSEAAKAKIEKVGGTVERIEGGVRAA